MSSDEVLPSVVTEDEADLIERARQGDVQAFTRLLYRHQGRVRAYIGGAIRRADVVDDLAQDVFIDAFRGMNAYLGRASFGVWLLGIARNKALMFMRDEMRRRKRETVSVEGVLAPEQVRRLESDENDLAARERELCALKQCLDSLPPSSAEVIAQRYMKARSVADIAKELGRREGAIRMTLLRIRQALRACVRQRVARENP